MTNNESETRPDHYRCNYGKRDAEDETPSRSISVAHRVDSTGSQTEQISLGNRVSVPRVTASLECARTSILDDMSHTWLVDTAIRPTPMLGSG